MKIHSSFHHYYAPLRFPDIYIFFSLKPPLLSVPVRVMPSATAVDEDIEMSRRAFLKYGVGEGPPSPRAKGHTQKVLRKPLIDGACIVLNITSTVVLVFLNKWQVLQP